MPIARPNLTEWRGVCLPPICRSKRLCTRLHTDTRGTAGRPLQRNLAASNRAENTRYRGDMRPASSAIRPAGVVGCVLPDCVVVKCFFLLCDISQSLDRIARTLSQSPVIVFDPAGPAVVKCFDNILTKLSESALIGKTYQSFRIDRFCLIVMSTIETWGSPHLFVLGIVANMRPASLIGKTYQSSRIDRKNLSIRIIKIFL